MSENVNIKTIGKHIKEFFDIKTKVYNEHHPEETVENVDKTCIYCVSPNNFVCTIKSILYLLKPFNPVSLPADDPAELDFGEIIYYNDPSGKERAVYIRLPILFAQGSDDTELKKWRDTKNKSESFLFNKKNRQKMAEANQKTINKLSDEFSDKQQS